MTWLIGNIRFVLIGAAILALAFLAGYFDGASDERTREAIRRAEAAKKVVKREARAEKITDRIAHKAVETRSEIRWRTKFLTKEVPVYVTPADDARCVVPRGFVQLHDAAASGLPAPAGGPDDAPTDVPLSAVAETVVANYGAGYDWRTEALTWREWYVEQRAAWDKP